MSHRKPLVAFVFASVAFSSFAFVGRGLAASSDTCTSDPDCTKGFTCQPWAVSGGTAPACPADAPDCAVTNDTPKSGVGGAGGSNGSTGSSGAGATTGTDVGTGNVSGTAPPTTVISRCAPGPCQTDSDCGPDMVCYAQSYSECSGGTAVPPCEAGTKCAQTDLVAPTCTTKTTSICAFHWQLPCNAAADCGAGFTCQPQISGTCSGGAPVSGGPGSVDGSGTGGSASTPNGSTSSPSATCTTTESFPGWCRPVDTICNVDADCPGHWVCQDVVTAPSRGEAAGAGAASGSGNVGSGTSATVADVAATGGVSGGTTASTRMCVSPFSTPTKGSDSGAGGRVGGSEGTPTNGGTPPSGTGGDSSNDGTGGPSTGTGGVTGAAQGPRAPADSAGASNDAGGCSVAGSGAGSGVSAGLSMLALLGLAVTARRRRR